MAETQFKFDLDLIRQDIEWIRNRYPIHEYPQIGLKHSDTELSAEQKILEGVGSNYDITTGKYRYDERKFSIFNKEFESTYLYEIHKALPTIGRFRIMTMQGPSCYTFHRDLTRRYHIAVDTNPDCLFMFVDLQKAFHIPADGNVYLLDTRLRHTFLNGSKHTRTHLVLDDVSVVRNTT